MNTNIATYIQKDMALLENLLSGNKYELANEEGGTTTLIAVGDNEFGGLMVAFDHPKSLICDKGEYDHERFLRLTDYFDTEAELLTGNVYWLKITVTFNGVEPISFTELYDFDGNKGLPLIMYQAYAYLRISLTLPVSTMLEIFGAITSAITFHHEEIFRTGLIGTMGHHFNVQSAITYDLQRLEQATNG
ncbi:hypothetical protein EF707_06120 [Vibrio fluvialis]|nr:hypothetical protein [Vibrio fluvialis]